MARTTSPLQPFPPAALILCSRCGIETSFIALQSTVTVSSWVNRRHFRSPPPSHGGRVAGLPARNATPRLTKPEPWGATHLRPPPRIPRMLPAPLRNAGALKAAPRASSLARTKSRCPTGCQGGMGSAGGCSTHGLGAWSIPRRRSGGGISLRDRASFLERAHGFGAWGTPGCCGPALLMVCHETSPRAGCRAGLSRGTSGRTPRGRRARAECPIAQDLAGASCSLLCFRSGVLVGSAQPWHVARPPRGRPQCLAEPLPTLSWVTAMCEGQKCSWRQWEGAAVTVPPPHAVPVVPAFPRKPLETLLSSQP